MPGRISLSLLKSEPKTKAYVYTIPKAGTYLMGAFISEIGFIDSGWHISEKRYLNTKVFDADVNKESPSETKVSRPYLGSFRSLELGALAFGHFNPMYVPPGILRQYKIVAVKRNLKEVLVSEFVDFRFRRSDVRFVGKQTIADSVKAFEVYMEQHAQIIKNIAQNFLILEKLSKDSDYEQLMDGSRFIFIDFRSFIDANKGPDLAYSIAKHFGLDNSFDDIKGKWAAALAADNKTKSDNTTMDVSREDLWSKRAVEIYETLGFDELNARLGYS